MALLALVFVAAANSLALADGLSGRAIMDEVSRRHDVEGEFQIQRMILEEKGGFSSERTLRRYSRKGQSGLWRYLLVFDDPQGVRGVALLTWEKATEDDQWTFLPAMGPQLKRIAGGGRSSNFMGTDFAYEDLSFEKRDHFNYERKEDVTSDGVNTFVIKATCVSSACSSGYSYRTIFIRSDNYMISRTEYYAIGSGRHIKTFIVHDMERAGDERWLATRTSMETLKDAHKTWTQTLSRSSALVDIPEDAFTHPFIQSMRHMR